MRANCLLAVALGALTLLGAEGAPAAERRAPHANGHPGHQPRAQIATYTVPAHVPVKVMRTTRAHPLHEAGHRFAQVQRRHTLMRGS